MSPRVIREHQLAAGNMTTGSTTAANGDASLTDHEAPTEEALDMMADHHRNRRDDGEDNSDTDEVPNWHTLRSLGSLFAELADDLERKAAQR